MVRAQNVPRVCGWERHTWRWWGWIQCTHWEVVGLGAKSGQGERERTHFSSWGLTNTSASCTSLNATASKRFCRKVLHRVFINQPLAYSLGESESLLSPVFFFFFFFGCFSS